jgi:YD repeat-containing protein
MKTGRELHSLHGPVRSVRIETAQLKEQDGQLTEEPWFCQTITFNRDGAVVEQLHRNPDGSEWRAVNDYSDSGKLLAMRHYEASGALNSERRYTYDEKGRLIAERHITREGKVTTPATYAYDEEGRRIMIQEFDFAEGENVMVGIEGTNIGITASEAKRIETRYDERGEAIAVEVFNAAGALASRVEVTRDERGNPLEETQYIGDTAPFGDCSTEACRTEETVELTEDQKAEFKAEIARLFAPGTVMSKRVHTYDEEGRLIESRLTMMGKEINRRTLAYDEFGNKSEEVSYREGDVFESKAIFAREYDDRGNWTKELVSSASSWDAEFGLSTPVHVTRRSITYY